MNHALRDPQVWGCEAHKFTLKDLSLYQNNHIGFADGAITYRVQTKEEFASGESEIIESGGAIQAFFLEYATQFNWQSTDFSGRVGPAVKGVPVWWDSFKVLKLGCGSGDEKLKTFKEAQCFGADPSCPDSWSTVAVRDAFWSCNDAVDCKGCCTLITLNKNSDSSLTAGFDWESWFSYPKCKHGWAEVGRDWEYGWRGALYGWWGTVSCQGCQGTWLERY
eukprot:gene57370-biopygen50687